jgi:hypothetical protein
LSRIDRRYVGGHIDTCGLELGHEQRRPLVEERGGKLTGGERYSNRTEWLQEPA